MRERTISRVKNKRKVHINIENIKNKVLGALLIILGILSAVLTGDGTAAVMTFFMGLSAILS